jgi:putative oxidoreductase
MIAKRIVVWILIVLLAAEFALAGASKLSPSSGWAPMFVAWGFPAWFRLAIGATEIACALALFIPRSRQWACAMLLVIMAGAAVTHLTHGEPRRVVLNVGVSALIGLLMRLGKKPSTSPTVARQTFETTSRTAHRRDEEEP